jgi:hypothetical protein
VLGSGVGERVTCAAGQDRLPRPVRDHGQGTVEKTDCSPMRLCNYRCQASSEREARMLQGYLLIGVALLCVPLALNHVSAQEYTINDHGKDCEREIGPIPPFSCLDGEIIPITRGGPHRRQRAHGASEM